MNITNESMDNLATLMSETRPCFLKKVASRAGARIAGTQTSAHVIASHQFEITISSPLPSFHTRYQVTKTRYPSFRPENPAHHLMSPLASPTRQPRLYFNSGVMSACSILLSFINISTICSCLFIVIFIRLRTSSHTSNSLRRLLNCLLNGGIVTLGTRVNWVS